MGLALVLSVLLAACNSTATPTPSPVAQSSIPPVATSVALATVEPSPSPTLIPPLPTPEATPLVVPGDCPGTATGSHARRQVGEILPDWAGYIAEQDDRGSVTCVEGTWVQPSVACPRNAYAAVLIWVGIDGLNDGVTGINASKTLVDTGTQAECNNGQLRIFAWEEALPIESTEHVLSVAIKVGDRVQAKVVFGSDGAFHLTIKNVTTHHSQTVTRKVSGAARQTADWIVGAAFHGCPKACAEQYLAKFQPIEFTSLNATIGGLHGGVDGQGATVFLGLEKNGVPGAMTGALTDAGTAFEVTWAHL